MQTRQLEMLLELSRLGSMRAVAVRLGTSTSTVSQQLAALADETGAPLLTREGRHVRLTPAGRRLAAHAVTIVGAVEAARRDLDADAPPAGTVHVSAFATAIRDVLLPAAASLATAEPQVKVVVHEHEPAEALECLLKDDVAIAITYDYNLAPVSFDAALASVELGSTEWGLGVPTNAARGLRGDAGEVFAAFREFDWIGNSRNPADELVVTVIASIAGFTPRLTHQSDNLDIVEDLIVNRMGVGLLPSTRTRRHGVTILPLSRPKLFLRAFAHVRRGYDAWPAVRVVLAELTSRSVV